MPSTRRQFLLGSSLTIAALSGCASFGEKSAEVEELTVELANSRDEPHTFHFAVETADGLGEWTSREVAPNTGRSVTRHPPDGYEPVAVHGVVDDQPATGELFGVDGTDADEVCLEVIFMYDAETEPGFLMSSDVRC